MGKATEELVTELKQAKTVEDFLNKNEQEFYAASLAELLGQLLEKYQKPRIEVIKTARLDYTYGYQIFDGKKRPRREKLLQLAFGFPLSLEDAEQVLCAGGVNGFNIHCKKDAICMYCLNKGMTLEECDFHLYQWEEETLTKEGNEGSR